VTERRFGVLVRVEHGRNAELLRAWLDRQDELHAVDEDERVDLVVVDADALPATRALIERLRERERPAYLPALLIASARTAAGVSDEVWRIVDDVLTTPVRPGELELRLRRLGALREATVATALRLEELGRSNVDLEQFASIAAHELAAPLSIVTGALETIAGRHRAELDPAVRPLLDAAERESERLHNLIADLLAFSRAHASNSSEEISLQAVLEDALNVLKPQLDAADVDVRVDSLPRVHADPGQLRIVLTNLVANAIKYRAADVPLRIRIGCDEEEARWLISVEDNGRGVRPGEERAIFEMFRRADGTRQSGHGIGLALCRRIVERHDGEIWVERAPDGGSIFRFSLPKR
jgi:signal transduction histidine kinase